MRRREFIALLGGAAVWPLVARAQPKEMPIIGVLRLDNEQHWFLESLREGLRDHGLVEGVNVKLLIRFADGDPAQLPGRARELAAAGSRVIVTNGTTLVAAVHSAAPSMPIVMAGSADPVAMGFAQSLARPGGRITGISILGAELIGKHMELLKDIAPKARLFVALLQSANPGNNRFRQAFADAGRTLAVEIQVREVRSEGELADAFALAKKLAADGVYIIQDPLFYRTRATLAKLPRPRGCRLSLATRTTSARGRLRPMSWITAASCDGAVITSPRSCAAPIPPKCPSSSRRKFT